MDDEPIPPPPPPLPPPEETLKMWNEAVKELGFPEDSDLHDMNPGAILRFAEKVWALRHRPQTQKE